MKKQHCPLDEAGVDTDDAGYGVSKNWIKDECRNCPLPRCIYDIGPTNKQRMQIRRARVKVLCGEGKSNRVIAELLGVSDSTIRNDVKVNEYKDY